MQLIGSVIGTILQIYLILLFVRAILSWIPALSRDFQPKGIVLVIFEAVYTLTDPFINFFERIIPPLRIGGVSISLGFLVAVLAIMLLQRINYAIFF